MSYSSVTEEEEDNFLHFYKLVVGIGTDAVRSSFDHSFPPSSLLATLQREEMKIRALGTNRILTAHQIGILFPSAGTTSSKQYDISLMVCLFRNVVKGNPPINGFDKLPFPAEKTMEADLARIKYYRNKMAHSESDKIVTTDFTNMWQEVFDAIIRLGGIKYMDVCNELKQTKLNKSLITDLRQEIAELQADRTESIQQLRDDIDTQLDTKYSMMGEKLEDTKNEMKTKIAELKTEKSEMVTKIHNIGITQQTLQKNVTDEKVEYNRRLLEVKREHDCLRSNIEESNRQKHTLGKHVAEIKTDQQMLHTQIDVLHLVQYKATQSDAAGKQELECLKSQIDTLRDDKERTIEHIQKLTNEDHIPSNIRDQLKRTIHEWKAKLKKFISTRAFEDVLAKINSNNCVTVTGNSGSGKSAIVRSVSLWLNEFKGYDIITISYPIELRNYYKPGKKMVFVIDDVCGKFTANKRQIDDWHSIIDIVNQVIADDSCKILLSCRLQVYKDAKFLELAPFQSCECNITSEELCLTIEEKNKFVKTYLNLNSVKVDIISRKNDLFPFLCDSFSTDKIDLEIEKYFNTPYSIYQKELESLKINGKYKFCGLCLCIMFNNNLKENFFVKLPKEFRRIVKDTCESIGLNRGTSAIKLRDELDTLENTYITKHDGFYAIYHDKLFDFMAYFFGQMMPQCFIDHADSGFLRERFMWKRTIDVEEHLVENMIYLGLDFLPSYIDRMISDWSNGKVSDVFYNINMKSSFFRETFLKILNENGRIQPPELSNMKDVYREDFASGNTPLIISCLDGHVDLLKWLLKHKAKVNECRKDGSSGLYMACQRNYVNVVKILLENNADINLCTDEGVSPLGIACHRHGNLQIIAEILKNNPDVNMYRYKENNMTPLFMACQSNYIETADELLKHDADPNICLHDGMSVLLLACQNEYTELVSLLIKFDADLNSEMRDGDTPLFSVSQMGFKDITKILLENGVDSQKCLHEKEVILKSLEGTSQSVEKEKLAWFENVKMFGSRKTVAHISTQSADYVFDVFAGSTPLHAACFMGHLEISKLLTKNIQSVDIQKRDGTTPLFYACEIGHIEIVRVLLEKRADPKMLRADKNSPLTIAQANGHADVLSLLCDHTCNV